MTAFIKKVAMATVLFCAMSAVSLSAQTQLTISKPMSEADYKEVQQILSGVDAKTFTLKANVASTKGAQAMTSGASKATFANVAQAGSKVGSGAAKASFDNFIVITRASSSQALEAAKLQKLQAIAAKYK